MGIIYSELGRRVWQKLPEIEEMLKENDINYHTFELTIDGAYCIVKHMCRSEWMHSRHIYVDVNRHGVHKERFFRITEDQSIVGNFMDDKNDKIFFKAVLTVIGLDAEASGILKVPFFDEEKKVTKKEERVNRKKGERKHNVTETAVIGHFRDMRVGKDRSEIKRVFIKPHLRHYST